MDNIFLGIVWFILLGFLPGYVLLGLFKLKEIDWVKGILYTIGLSIVFDMAVGFVINLTYPLLGIMPFNRIALSVTWLSIMAGFLIVVALKNGKLLRTYKWDTQWKVIIPIYVVSVLIVYSTSLLTNNLVGSDIHLEYYYANQSVLNGFNNTNFNAYINVCLPITILIPTYSVLSGIEIMWVFKIVQPLVLGLLPIILYKIYELQFGKVIGILSVIFFITLPFFTMDMVQLIRQQYAMMFFALVTLVLISRNINLFTRIVLGSIFGVGVSISHYGVGVGFMGYMIISSLVILVLKLNWIQWLWIYLTKRELPVDITNTSWKSVISWVVITVVCVGGGLLYYNNVGSQIGIYAVSKPIAIAQNTVATVVVVNHPVETPTTTPTDTPKGTIELSNEWQQYLDVTKREPLLRTAVGLDFAESSDLGKVWRVILYLVELCILIGLIRFVIRPPKGLRTEFFVFLIGSAFVVIGLYILPVNGFGLGAVRVLVVTLIFLAPLFIYGLDTILYKFRHNQIYLILLTSLILIPFILFNCGAVFEMTKSNRSDIIDIPFSIFLSAHRLELTAYYTDKDVEAMEWLKDKISVEYPEYGDMHSYQLACHYVGQYGQAHDIASFCGWGQGYIFLRENNIKNETFTVGTTYGCRKEIPWLEYSNGCKPMKDILENGKVVFDNGAKIIKVTRGGN